MISFKYNHKKTEQSSSCKTLRTENRPRSTSPPPPSRDQIVHTPRVALRDCMCTVLTGGICRIRKWDCPGNKIPPLLLHPWHHRHKTHRSPPVGAAKTAQDVFLPTTTWQPNHHSRSLGGENTDSKRESFPGRLKKLKVWSSAISSFGTEWNS